MSSYSRRRILRDLGMASAAGMISLALPGQKARRALLSTDLYLIFPGAWLACFEKDVNGKPCLNLVTTDCSCHLYDMGITLPKGQSRLPIAGDQVYNVTVNGYTPSTDSTTLVAPMIKANQGLIFSGIKRNSSKPAGLRTISAPIPATIEPAALLAGVTINADPSVTYNSNIQYWPAALVLTYPGWTSATVTRIGDTQPLLTAQPGQAAHLSFRTCITGRCNMPAITTVDCDQIDRETIHAQAVFKSIMDLLDLGGKAEPTLCFPKCTPGVGGTPDTWGGVSIVCGSDSNIDPTEIGMPSTSYCGRSGGGPFAKAHQFFANLHNCAAGVGIVGA
jgi:hypothetical protein